MTFATEISAEAAAVVLDLGNTATFHDKTSDVYDPTTGRSTAMVEDRVLRVGGPFGYASGLVDGDLIQSKDAYVILPALDLTWVPDTGEQVTVSSRRWTILRVTEHKTQDVIVAWELQLR